MMCPHLDPVKDAAKKLLELQELVGRRREFLVARVELNRRLLAELAALVTLAEQGLLSGEGMDELEALLLAHAGPR